MLKCYCDNELNMKLIFIGLTLFFDKRDLSDSQIIRYEVYILAVEFDTTSFVETGYQ